jgi:hypothetical protein
LFEAYIKDLLSEIVAFHGGAAGFVATSDRRARRFLQQRAAHVTAAKRKLQEPAKKNKAEKYRKFSQVLSKEGVRFPSELLASLGVRTLVRRATPKGMRAADIPDILREGLSFPLTDAQKQRLDTIRDLRNRVAHRGHPETQP